MSCDVIATSNVTLGGSNAYYTHATINVFIAGSIIESKENILMTVTKRHREPIEENVATTPVNAHAWLILALLCVAKFVNTCHKVRNKLYS